MSATLTINLDSDVLQSAEQEAKARHTTLPEVVAHQLRVLARNWQDSRAGKTPVTDALRGAVQLPPDFEERTALTEAAVPNADIDIEGYVDPREPLHTKHRSATTPTTTSCWCRKLHRCAALARVPDVLRFAKTNHFLGHVLGMVGDAFQAFGGGDAMQATLYRVRIGGHVVFHVRGDN